MKIFQFVFLIIFCFGTAIAQTPQPILEDGDISKFIETFPKIKADMEKFNEKFDSEEMDFSMLNQAFGKNSEFLAILEKHGWDSTYFAKTMVISMGFASLEGDKEQEINVGIKESIKEIDNNPNLTAEQKEQMKTQLMQAQTEMSGFIQGMRTKIHEADLNKIKARREALKKLFEEDQ